MAKIYFNRIIDGRITLEEVPDKLREQVKEMLIEYGFIT